MKYILQGLAVMTVIILMHAIPQWINTAISLLPKPLPEMIGAGMLIMFAVTFLWVLNRMMKGMSR